jgi:hypothetical protein
MVDIERRKKLAFHLRHLSVGLLKRKEKEQAFPEFQKLGNFDIWPFLKIEDYEEQLKFQPFLNG